MRANKHAAFLIAVDDYLHRTWDPARLLSVAPAEKRERGSDIDKLLKQQDLVTFGLDPTEYLAHRDECDRVISSGEVDQSQLLSKTIFPSELHGLKRWASAEEFRRLFDGSCACCQFQLSTYAQANPEDTSEDLLGRFDRFYLGKPGEYSTCTALIETDSNHPHFTRRKLLIPCFEEWNGDAPTGTAVILVYLEWSGARLLFLKWLSKQRGSPFRFSTFLSYGAEDVVLFLDDEDPNAHRTFVKALFDMPLVRRTETAFRTTMFERVVDDANEEFDVTFEIRNFGTLAQFEKEFKARFASYPDALSVAVKQRPGTMDVRITVSASDPVLVRCLFEGLRELDSVQSVDTLLEYPLW
ncbi:MAG: hypothetical protein AAF493_16210 [Pseudomonadota bacterium]